MHRRLCSIGNCGRPHLARGWCRLHYERWRSSGDPQGGGRHYATPEESFAARTKREGGCLVWIGGRNENGYGTITINRSRRLAHRYAWERINGPIADGMVIDHVCWNPACCEITHLRAVTRMENQRYRKGPQRNNRLGLRGVYEIASGFKARVDFGGTYRIDPAVYPTAQEASRAAHRMRAEIFGEFQGGN